MISTSGTNAKTNEMADLNLFGFESEIYIKLKRNLTSANLKFVTFFKDGISFLGTIGIFQKNKCPCKIPKLEVLYRIKRLTFK